jgi:transposase
MLRRPLLPKYRPPAGRRPARQVELFEPPKHKTKEKPTRSSLPASRRLVWLLVHEDEQLDDEAKQQRAHLCHMSEVALAQKLTQQFRALMREQAADELSMWLEACQSSGISELASFAEGLQREDDQAHSLWAGKL